MILLTEWLVISIQEKIMTKEHILKIATKEFSQYGYDAVSMNDLAKKSNLNKATIYHHFADKKSLYQAVIQNLIDNARDKRDTGLSEDLSPKEKFKKYIRFSIESMKENTEMIPLLLREMANFGSNMETSIEQEVLQEKETLKEIVATLNLKEKYKNMDIYDLQCFILGTLSMYYSMQMSPFHFDGIHNFDKDSNKTLDYVGSLVTDMILDAICEEQIC